MDDTIHFNAVKPYRNTIMADTDKGAAMQFITRSIRSGTVGRAYIGVLRRKTNSYGFTSIFRDSGFPLMLSHELGLLLDRLSSCVSMPLAVAAEADDVEADTGAPRE
jgi:hypothetical protein